MKKEITIGNDTFYYTDNNHFICITGYQYKDNILFTKEEDGRKYFHIRIPETIDNLPVLVVEKLYVAVNPHKEYRHNGYDVVKIHIPENAAFLGLESVRIDQYSVLTPNFSEEYYPRKNTLMQFDEGAYHFFAKKLDNTTCEIVVITNDPCLKKDWVWEKTKQDNSIMEKIVIPSEIEGCSVIRICTGSTDSLTENVKEIYIGEGIKEIGENCFCQLPFISDVYLPKSIEQINEGAFGYFLRSEYLKKVPTLYVHYHETLPVIKENAFVRKAIREDYEDYSDWGNMYVGSTNIDYDVVYLKYVTNC